MPFNDLQDGINPINHGSISVDLPIWPSMSQSTNDPHLDEIPGIPPSEVIPDKETVDTQNPDLSYTSDTMKTEGHREIVGVEIVGSISYDTTTGLYNNQRKYLEQWNPWYSYWSIYNLNQAQLFPKQRNMWIDHGLSPGMDNFELE